MYRGPIPPLLRISVVLAPGWASKTIGPTSSQRVIRTLLQRAERSSLFES